MSDLGQNGLKDLDLNALQTIGKFTLKNQGGFVAKMQYNYYNKTGKHHSDGNDEGIDLGQSQTDDPGRYGVNDGDVVVLYVDVVWGSDNIAKQQFIYRKGNPNIAHYTISGTTFDNELGLNWVGS
ncbi:hypothetical protein [Burkholderia sp. AU16482]|uniref:hypothetical protein n=1 Tax=Burkholderia sp. AU16482 TaxID=2015346 RepID=UPI000B79DC1B|nr:hypothetical protein [Burkholderia sp. AU16482]OXI26876.1 hypothetical protein CFB35_09905 [Burkholderia sp. AU16482]